MALIPESPSKDLPLEEQLAEWKKIKAYAGKGIINRKERIADRRADIRDAKKRIKKLKQLIAINSIDWNGNSSAVTRKIKKVAKAANRHGLYITSTTGGTHAPTSWHYQGRAIDVAGSYSQMVEFQNYCANRWPGALEVFGPDSFYIKNGSRYSGAFPDHGDHVHIAR